MAPAQLRTYVWKNYWFTSFTLLCKGHALHHIKHSTAIKIEISLIKDTHVPQENWNCLWAWAQWLSERTNILESTTFVSTLQTLGLQVQTLTGQTSTSAKRCNIICHAPQASRFQHQSLPTETGPTLPFVVEKASPAQIHGTTAQTDWVKGKKQA